MPDVADIVVETLGSDGDGIATHPDGGRLYVPFTVRGDVARVRPASRRGEGWAAEVEEIVVSGPDRIAAACEHFGACGGCVAQHLNETAYLDWKVERLRAALRRAGFVDPEIAPVVPGSPGTRRRMDLAVRRVQGGVLVGLHRARDAEVVNLLACPVLHPALFALIAPLRAVLPGLSAVRRDASIIVNLLDSGPDLLLRTDGDLVLTDRAKLTDFARAHGLPRISWSMDGVAEAVCVLAPPVTSLSGVMVAPPAGAFLQATAAGEAAIIEAVVAGLPVKRVARTRVLELFAGCGTISFALAPQIKVLAVEGDGDLVAACHAGINRGGLTGKMEIVRRDLARQPFQAKELGAFAAVILDPPHGGAAAQMPLIAAARVPIVIYVSCDPVSLGRDAAVLFGAGYRLERATPIDQFLWSARLEAVAVFRVGR